MSLPKAIEVSADAPIHAGDAGDAGNAVGWARRRHVLDLDDFSPSEIEDVLESANGMAEVLKRDIKKVPTLRGRVIVTLFYESSTRTRVSFEEAGKILSADVINVSTSAAALKRASLC